MAATNGLLGVASTVGTVSMAAIDALLGVVSIANALRRRRLLRQDEIIDLPFVVIDGLDDHVLGVWTKKSGCQKLKTNIHIKTGKLGKNTCTQTNIHTYIHASIDDTHI